MKLNPDLKLQHFMHVSVSSLPSVVLVQDAEEAAEPEGGSLQDPAVQVNPCLPLVHCISGTRLLLAASKAGSSCPGAAAC